MSTSPLSATGDDDIIDRLGLCIHAYYTDTVCCIIAIIADTNGSEHDGSKSQSMSPSLFSAADDEDIDQGLLCIHTYTLYTQHIATSKVH